MELEKRYDHKLVEQDRYEQWLKLKLFGVDANRKEKYTIVIPPPNVTGKLHLGHAWDNTLQDILIRFHHSLGKDVLYLPGMDHAGIATQAVVEGKLREKGISRYDLGRENFLKEMWKWKDEYALNIRKQWAKLGLALNYDVERFTLDEGLSHAVKEVFIKLYRQGLIYRGERIINWDPDQQTALSNIEVIHKEIAGNLYYCHYRLVDGKGSLIVATTRPETMFADVCLVVNPEDERYTHLVGKQVINPSNGEIIPIIADAYVDKSFGTGVMKCTPAHDANDFAISERHGLARPLCIEKNGKINARGHRFQGLDRFEARQQLIAYMQAEGNVEKIEPITHAVGHSERSDAIVEPYLSKQWFVKMKPLAEQVLALQASEGKINFFPSRFEQTLQQWMEKVEDWCISRQLWWGHQIPAWYHKETGEVYVGIEPPKNLHDFEQDADVLDTWFSSALWPFSTLGWPDDSHLLKQYFPTSTMVTGYDIIFFWVARMVFQSLHFLGKKPFQDVLVHGIIRDAQGRKMSKSLGNGVDPIKVIDQYGTDALRIYLATNSSPGQDTRYIEEKVEAQANYLNKIWNSARFILSYLPSDFVPTKLLREHLDPLQVGILDRLNQVLSQVKTNLLKYEIGFASTLIYDFVYDDFCSWYLEFSKVSLNQPDAQTKTTTLNVLYHILKSILIILHPFAPFITEAIYQHLPQHLPSLYQELYPNEIVLGQSDPSFALLRKMIADIRSYKVDHQLAPNAALKLAVQVPSPALYQAILPYLERFSFSQVQPLEPTLAPTAAMTSYLYPEGKMLIEELVDPVKMLQQLNATMAHLTSEIARAKSMLANPRFVEKAPPQKVKEEQDKLALFEKQLAETQAKLSLLKR
ncbi:MAG: valine--tRNA ligase [Bacilli bacterium]